MEIHKNNSLADFSPLAILCFHSGFSILLSTTVIYVYTYIPRFESGGEGEETNTVLHAGNRRGSPNDHGGAMV